jgi:hypothetical protein
LYTKIVKNRNVYIFVLFYGYSMDYVASLQRQGILNTERPTTTSFSQQSLQQNQVASDREAMLLRLANTNKERITSLEKEVSHLTQQLAKVMEFVEKLQDTETVTNARRAIQERRDRPPVDRPIDRNNVAPSQVQLENIFYSGRR